MGCGQSKIGNIYMKNKKKKSNQTKQINDPTRSSSIDQKNGTAKNNKANNNGIEVNRNEDQSGLIDNKNVPKKKVAGPGNGPLQHQTELSSSQVDFFRMLDEKIENGPDYDENMDTLRPVHVTNLSRHWEFESILWPDVQELTDTTSVITTEISTNTIDESYDCLNNSKDLDSIRNIMSGRSEIGPVFTRNANRVDGLQNIHSPSANMPRHVLESISQSPTQTLKYSAGTSSEFTRYDEFIDEKNLTIGKKMASSRNNCQPNNDDDDDDDDYDSVLHREQYLQQSGIISVQPQYQSGNVIRNNSYIQQFQTTNSEGHFKTSKNRSFNTVKMT